MNLMRARTPEPGRGNRNAEAEAALVLVLVGEEQSIGTFHSGTWMLQMAVAYDLATGGWMSCIHPP